MLVSNFAENVIFLGGKLMIKGLINYIIAIIIVLLLWLIDWVDKSLGCESIPETQAVVTLYDGNVLTTAELRLESGQVLIHTSHRGLHGRPWL